MLSRRWRGVLLVACLFLLAGCGDDDQVSPAPTPTTTPRCPFSTCNSGTPQPTLTAPPTVTPSPPRCEFSTCQGTPAPTNTPLPAPTNTALPTPTSAATVTPTQTAPTPTPIISFDCVDQHGNLTLCPTPTPPPGRCLCCPAPVEGDCVPELIGCPDHGAVLNCDVCFNDHGDLVPCYAVCNCSAPTPTPTATPQRTNCVESIAPQSATFLCEGGTGSFKVSAPDDCCWEAAFHPYYPQPSQPVHILSGSGCGDGVVNYAVAKYFAESIAWRSFGIEVGCWDHRAPSLTSCNCRSV